MTTVCLCTDCPNRQERLKQMSTYNFKHATYMQLNYLDTEGRLDMLRIVANGKATEANKRRIQDEAMRLIKAHNWTPQSRLSSLHAMSDFTATLENEAWVYDHQRGSGWCPEYQMLIID